MKVKSEELRVKGEKSISFPSLPVLSVFPVLPIK